MKILLVQPPKTTDNLSICEIALSEPLAMEILAANLADYDVKVLDMRLEDKLEETLSKFQPQVVCTTAFTAEVYRACNVLKIVKDFDRNICTIIGGHHATLSPADFNKEYIDIVVIGEGEYVIRKIVQTLEQKKDLSDIEGLAIKNNGNLKFTNTRKAIEDLDSLPFPDRNITKKYREHYFRGNWKPTASIYSSRGCPFRCDFCAMWKVFNGKYRIRTVKNFVDELETISEIYVNFTDDNTFHNLNYAEELYKEIKSRGINKKYKLYGRSDTVIKRPDIFEKWKSIGMELLLMGVEAFRDEDLKAWNKNNTIKNNEEAIKILHKNNVGVVAYFMVEQNFTNKDFDDLSKYVKNLGLTHPIFTILTPFPGTELYKKRSSELTTNNLELFDAIHSILPTKMPLKEFYQNFINLYKRAYSNNNKFLSDDMINSLLNKFVKEHNL